MDVLKYVSLVYGDLFAVISSGIILMLVLLVKNRVFHSMVCFLCVLCFFIRAPTANITYCYTGSISASNWYTDRQLIPLIHSVQCNGTEEAIFDCIFRNDSSAQCGIYQDASVICQGLSCINFIVRT